MPPTSPLAQLISLWIACAGVINELYLLCQTSPQRVHPAPHFPSQQAVSSPPSLAEISSLHQTPSARGAQLLPSPSQGKQSASVKPPQVSLAHTIPVNPCFILILPCGAGNTIYPTLPIHGKLVQEGAQHGAPAFALPQDVGGMGASLEPALLAGFPWLPHWSGMQLQAGSQAGLSPLPRVHACNQPLRVMPAR